MKYIPDNKPSEAEAPLLGRVPFLYKKAVWTIKRYREYLTLLGVLCAVFFYVFFLSAPQGFPVGVIVKIPSGTTVNEASLLLKEKNIIRSTTFFKGLVLLRSGERGVIAGDYFFSRERNVFHITRRIAHGEYGLTPLSITIPEGSTVVEMALIYEKFLGGFDALHFVEVALPFEGYLFPDTYFFLPNVEEEEIVRTMRENFDIRIQEIQKEISESEHTLEEIVIMASLLEEEAHTTESRRMIAGLLWNRLSIGMPLQVDAVFPYILGKNTFEVTLEDLRVDSLYNTYRYKGLPFGPITNPSLDSLRAAADPISNDYVFYLSDLDGNIHYSRTFEEHKAKKRIYIP